MAQLLLNAYCHECCKGGKHLPSDVLAHVNKRAGFPSQKQYVLTHPVATPCLRKISPALEQYPSWMEHHCVPSLPIRGPLSSRYLRLK